MNSSPGKSNITSQQDQGGNINSLTQERATESNAIQIPEISLPKGGGALKGIDEKFEVNAANGTAGFSIPLPITPGRNDFSPSLLLSYNSGGGNSPFGLGWSNGLSSIQRKTDKQLPRYRDALEEDVFMFSGVEDLVPFLKDDGSGNFLPVEKDDNGYAVKRYRPRIEGGFARIEKIQHQNHGVYWKVTTGDNIATIFGRSTNTKIFNPEDNTQVFQWLPEFSYDDKGNWIKYEYKLEDLSNVPNEVYEKNRKNGTAQFTNLYLKKVQYGNRIAYYADKTVPYDPQSPSDNEHFFELVFDYGEHDELNPSPIDTGTWKYRSDAFSSYRSGFEIRTNRLCKRVLMFHHFKDEKQFVGTPEEEVFGGNYLVRSLDLAFEPSSINGSGQSETTYLKSITQSGYIRKPDGSYSKKSLPPIEFNYEKLNWNKTIKTVSPENIVNAPFGLTNNYQWVDLYGEGISGILSEHDQGWFYKSNFGDIDEDGDLTFTVARKVIPKPSFSGLSNGTVSIQDLEANGQKQVVINSENLKGYFELTSENEWTPFNRFEQTANINLQDPNTRLIDLNGDGQPEIVITEDNAFTWYAALGKSGYDSAEKTFKSIDEDKGPAIVFADQKQSIFIADVTGDGLSDILRIRNGEVCYWANKGYGKFSSKVTMGNAPFFDHEDLFNPQYLHLADVSGTGATDLIYLGKNKFKAFINLSGNAWSDAHEIDPFFPIDGNSQLSVVDLLGTGTSCIVWSSDLPAYANAPMQYIDLMNSKKPHVLIHYKNNFGKETSIEYKSSTHYYLKDKLEGKPWITKLPFPVQVVSKLVIEEKVTSVRFSTEYFYHHGYYDHPEREFRGFGMVEQKDSEFYEEWSRNNISGQLEKSEMLYQKPVLVKTWFHTGAYLEKEKILSQYKEEYWYNVFNKKFPLNTLTVVEPGLPDANLSNAIQGLNGDEYREALRACKGMMLRQEVFALDAPDTPTNADLQLQSKPYSVATHNCNIQLLQPRKDNHYGVFLVTESEAISIEYERNETDYRLSHTLNTKFDELGNILESASVVYGREQAKADADFQLLSSNITDFSEDVLNGDVTQKTQLQNAFINNIQAGKNEQLKRHLIFTQNSFSKYDDGTNVFNDIDLSHVYRLRLPLETKTFELTGFSPANDLFTLADFDTALIDSNEIGYQENSGGGKEKRLIEHVKSKYLDANLDALDFGFYDILGLSHESYQLAYTPDLVKEIFSKQDGTELQAGGTTVSNLIKSKGKFSEFNNDGLLWIRSGKTHFKVSSIESIANVRERFFSPIAFEDPFGAIFTVEYDTETFGTSRNNDGYYLYIKSTTDAIDNKVLLDVFNYRTMSPARMIDINANPTSIILDELGLVKAMAVEGNGVFSNAQRTSVTIVKPADSLAGIKEYSTPNELARIVQLFSAATYNSTNNTQLKTAGSNLLQQASGRFIYDFDTYQNNGSQPVVGVGITREEHFADNNSSKIQFGFEYSDGLGNLAMAKIQAESGLAYYMDNGVRIQKDTGTDLRWVGNGRTILNNKGNPVKQYEPYFSTNFLYEQAPELVEIGVTPILFYDSLGRMVKTIFPDDTLSRIEFDSWKQINYDQIDTIGEDECLWYLRRTDHTRSDFINDPKEQRAANEAFKLSNTPSYLFLDSLGRPMLSIENNAKDITNKDKFYTTFIQLDIEGNTKSVTDARGNDVMSYQYDILGHRVYQNSMDAGERWVVNNLMGNPIHRWDNREHIFSFDYDTIQRPLSIKVEEGDEVTALDHIYEYVEYGENTSNQYEKNLRGQVIKQYDTAGLVENQEYDFKGNLLLSTRQFNADYKNIPNWIATNRNSPSFDPDLMAYSSQVEFDALNRAVNTVTPDNSETKPVFNDAGFLEQVRVKQNGIAEKEFVKNIDYDAKGQRTKIVYGDKNNNALATTTYVYDEFTFRLTHLKTIKSNGDLLQDLYYTYDPLGNIAEIEDKAVPTKFFNNFKIEPKGLYKYNALYRLIEAEGKEHAGQAINFGQCGNWKDQNFLKSYNPGDDMTWRKYTQKYIYDPVGNILENNHDANGGNWTRSYEYESNNNRLKETTIGSQTYTYPHHAQHGFMTSLPHLQIMEWNFKDELQAVATQKICTGVDPEITYYVYDSSGQRVRKVTENHGGGSKKQERIYLGRVEVYKKHIGNHSGLERTTLHVMDDTHRIAMIDTRNAINDNTDQRTVRFQFNNHLGSAALEVDDGGEVISYEEYHPYGTTAYQAVNKYINAIAKRYRYTGMERDEENGLGYHNARYYMCWLGRWLKSDPIGIGDGINVFSFCKSNPLKFKDSTGNKSNINEGSEGRNSTNEFYISEIVPSADTPGNITFNYGTKVHKGEGPTQIAERMSAFFGRSISWQDIVASNPQYFQSVKDISNKFSDEYRVLNMNPGDKIRLTYQQSISKAYEYVSSKPDFPVLELGDKQIGVLMELEGGGKVYSDLGIHVGYSFVNASAGVNMSLTGKGNLDRSGFTGNAVFDLSGYAKASAFGFQANANYSFVNYDFVSQETDTGFKGDVNFSPAVKNTTTGNNHVLNPKDVMDSTFTNQKINLNFDVSLNDDTAIASIGITGTGSATQKVPIQAGPLAFLKPEIRFTVGMSGYVKGTAKIFEYKPEIILNPVLDTNTFLVLPNTFFQNRLN